MMLDAGLGTPPTPLLISVIFEALHRHACMHASFVLRLLALQHHLRSMPLTSGETICQYACWRRGARQDVQAVTRDNFCPGSSGAEAAPGSSNQVGSSSGSSSNQAGSSPDRATMADDDYDEYNGLDGYADADDDDVSNDDCNGNSDDQSDDDLHGDQQQQGNDASAEGDDDNDDTNKVTDDQEVTGSSPAVCNRLQDYQSLVDHAQFEWQKEQIDGHIRSNSLVFNTFIFLQVPALVVLA